MAPLQRGEPPKKKLGACIERGELQMDENRLKDELIAKLSSNVDTTVLQMVDTALASVLSDYEVAKRNTQLSTGVLRFPELEIYIAKMRFDNKAKSTIDQYSKFLGGYAVLSGETSGQDSGLRHHELPKLLCRDKWNIR